MEIKYGRKVATSGGRTRPQRLKHFLVVDRRRDKENFIQNQEVHEALGTDKPTEVPIVLLSDLPSENFALFRGLFHKGSLFCGAMYGEPEAKRYYKNGKAVEPYNVKCSDECPFWQETDKAKQCDLTGTLYFRLHPKLPNSNALGVLRVGGIHAMRRIRASLQILYKQTGGILANIPLIVRIHEETKRTQGGETHKVPMISIEPAGSQMKLMENVMEEVERRSKMFEMVNGHPHESLKDLQVTDVLREVNARDAVLQSIDSSDDIEVFDEVEDSEETTPEAVISDELRATLSKLPTAKADALIIRFMDASGSVNEEGLKKYVERQLQRG